MSQYTDEDVRAVGLAIDATMPLHGSEDEQIDYAARAVLDAVAPAIAARALREAEAEFASRTQEAAGQVREHWRGQDFVDGQDTAYESAADWLHARADEIANGRI